ncbi:Serine carboxypeptidase-like 41 [Theobroma cacao]|uniref:Serine carboxypeptidase-like 41 n=1 Tax=Theobroma cacao TaxID=3641 RepID=A0A061F7F5_THECC|nr:Serine carboxypeptidase-like 41 [Theobroma cacao]
MININLHEQILKECNGIDEDNHSNNATKWSEPCQQAMDKAEMAALMFFETLVMKNGKTLSSSLLLQVTKVSSEVDMCIPFWGDFYFNIPEVQNAFHRNQTNLRYQWKGCFEKSGLKYSDADKDIDMHPALKKILQQSIPITIFRFLISPFVFYLIIYLSFFFLINNILICLINGQGGGWMYSYDNLLNFMTVKGANHHVTFSKPSEALFIFTNIVLNQSQ